MIGISGTANECGDGAATKCAADGIRLQEYLVYPLFAHDFTVSGWFLHF